MNSTAAGSQRAVPAESQPVRGLLYGEAHVMPMPVAAISPGRQCTAQLAGLVLRTSIRPLPQTGPDESINFAVGTCPGDGCSRVRLPVPGRPGSSGCRPLLDAPVALERQIPAAHFPVYSAGGSLDLRGGGNHEYLGRLPNGHPFDQAKHPETSRTRERLLNS
jgi:hypothetical protein